MKYEYPFVGIIFRRENGVPYGVIYVVISEVALSEITVTTDGEEEIFRTEDPKSRHAFLENNLKSMLVKEFKDRKLNKHTAEAKATDVKGHSFVTNKTIEKRNGDFWEEY